MDRTRNLTYNGLIIALTVAILYFGAFTKSKLSFLAIASFLLAISVIVSGIKGGILAIVATDILSFLLIPNLYYKLVFIPISFYPIIKSLAEKRKYSWALKYAYFNLSLFAMLIFGKIFLYQNFSSTNLPIFIIVLLIFELGFYFYDYAFTKFVFFIVRRIF
ncbi:MULTISPECIES: hypothetical protein [Caloramator]|uniref:Predicted membrane protein n=1 Tax=Caloramator australicus RC3 TaxID=857293 RepID=I7LG95_9CLOT|nr:MULTISPECIES: hypothetical protein [Caloramator]MDO6354874.1 hypothetical protein [Caloramator sp. CAR-1]CCJ33110.1 Predicted membrane protein [Caloramator australicus RC3]